MGYAPLWSEVFLAAAEDDKYWDREVRRPALRFLASRGGTAMQMEKNNKAFPPQFLNIEGNPKRETLPYVHSEAMRKHGSHGSRKRKASGSQPPASSKGAGKGKGKLKTDKNGHHFMTRENKQICFAFAK